MCCCWPDWAEYCCLVSRWWGRYCCEPATTAFSARRAVSSWQLTVSLCLMTHINPINRCVSRAIHDHGEFCRCQFEPETSIKGRKFVRTFITHARRSLIMILHRTSIWLAQNFSPCRCRKSERTQIMKKFFSEKTNQHGSAELIEELSSDVKKTKNFSRVA